MGKHTRKTLHNKPCKHCGQLVVCHGSGRPPRCNDCRLRLMRERQKRLYVPKPKTKMLENAKHKARQRNMVAAEKQARGKCAHHLHNFGNDLFVTHDLLPIFEFDHLDRSQKIVIKGKRAGVGRMAGAVTDAVLLAEMSKCQLLCSNCHQLKTAAERHWVPVAQQETPFEQQTQLQLQLK